MKIIGYNLGYRELHMLANFALKIAENGIPDDVADTITWDTRKDSAYCITESGRVIYDKDGDPQ